MANNRYAEFCCYFLTSLMNFLNIATHHADIFFPFSFWIFEVTMRTKLSDDCKFEMIKDNFSFILCHVLFLHFNSAS